MNILNEWMQYNGLVYLDILLTYWIIKNRRYLEWIYLMLNYVANLRPGVTAEGQKCSSVCDGVMG